MPDLQAGQGPVPGVSCSAEEDAGSSQTAHAPGWDNKHKSNTCIPAQSLNS